MGRLGRRGGLVVRFEKTFPRVAGGRMPPGVRAATVAVLGELFRHSCVALRLLSPAIGRERIWRDLGFLNRPGSK
jgi:hypothetical protein